MHSYMYETIIFEGECQAVNAFASLDKFRMHMCQAATVRMHMHACTARLHTSHTYPLHANVHGAPLRWSLQTTVVAADHANATVLFHAVHRCTYMNIMHAVMFRNVCCMHE
jgi:hypothetical protein